MRCALGGCGSPLSPKSGRVQPHSALPCNLAFWYSDGVMPFTFLNARMKLVELVYPTLSYKACIVRLA